MYETIFKSVIVFISNYNFTPFALAVFLTSWITLAIGILVLIREKASRESLFFSLITLAIFFWLCPNSFIYASPDAETALSWSRLSFIGVSFIPSAFFQFTVFALRTSLNNRRMARFGWIISFFFAILALTFDEFYSGVELHPWGYFPHYGWLVIPFLIFLSIP